MNYATGIETVGCINIVRTTWSVIQTYLERMVSYVSVKVSFKDICEKYRKKK